ncbi:hypothetical protein ACWD3J_45320 [Streptomyces sp. NPDC002755]|uniref:hypothetical protein n=1 Tax=Streptomyces sp. NPDC002884 TaxID=3154544 RepID=UPI00332C7C28
MDARENIEASVARQLSQPHVHAPATSRQPFGTPSPYAVAAAPPFVTRPLTGQASPASSSLAASASRRLTAEEEAVLAWAQKMVDSNHAPVRHAMEMLRQMATRGYFTDPLTADDYTTRYLKPEFWTSEAAINALRGMQHKYPQTMNPAQNAHYYGAVPPANHARR